MLDSVKRALLWLLLRTPYLGRIANQIIIERYAAQLHPAVTMFALCPKCGAEHSYPAARALTEPEAYERSLNAFLDRHSRCR